MGTQNVVLVTGASSGIGKASAKMLIENGMTVYATARRIHLMKDLEEMGAKVMKCDVTSDEDVQSVVDTIIKNEGRIDIVFANAGYCLLGPVELHSSTEVSRQFDVNVVGCARVISAALPHMREQRSGRIIITSSVAGHIGMPGMVWYPATKHAQQALGDGLRMEVKEFGIKVSLIEPGYINTDIDNASFPYLDMAEAHPNAQAYQKQMKAFRKKWGKGIDKGSSPDTIAEAVLQAATADKPKRRYHPNSDARMGIFLRRFFGYGLLDAMMPRQLIK